MNWLLTYLKVFLVGGLICLIAQVFISKTKITAGKLLVCIVTSGVVLSALGIYQPIVDFGKAGATVPLFGFGHTLAQGAIEGAKEKGILGAFTGGVTATAAGIAAAVFFGYLNALIFKSRSKKNY